MAYLIDASSLIEAKDRYYGFDFCPGYWDWLEQQNALGNVFSIDRIFDELDRGSDLLTNWVRHHKTHFFLPTDEDTLIAFAQVSLWVNSADFKPQAKSEFLSGADPFLVAFAIAHHHIVVTDEIYTPGTKRMVKIPAVCQQFGVSCVSPFEMLRQSGAKFVLP